MIRENENFVMKKKKKIKKETYMIFNYFLNNDISNIFCWRNSCCLGHHEKLI